MDKFKISKYILNLLIIASLITSNFIFSQNENTPQPKEEEKVEELKAIPVIEIPQQIEEAYTFIKEIESLQIPSKPIEKLEEEFKEILSRDSSLKVESTPEFIEELPARKLEDFRNKWNSYLNSILQYKKVLEDDAAKISEIRAVYQNFDKRWALTYDNAKNKKAPKALQDRLKQLNKDVKTLDKLLAKALNDILLLRDKVSTEELSSNEKITIIEEAVKAQKSMLLSFDSPPIWKAFADSADTTTYSERLSRSKDNIVSSFIEFYELYDNKIIHYLLFFLIVFALVFYLGKFAKENVESLKADGDESFSLNVLSKPFSISLLITLFTSEFFFPLAPRTVNEIFSIMFIIPLLSLVPTYISKESRGPLYFITSIYLLQQILELGSSSTTNQRFIVIILIILSIIAFALVLKIQISKIYSDRKNFLSLISLISKVMIFILSLSLLANFIGSTKLSKLVLNGVMTGIYHTLLLITYYQVFQVLLKIFLETRFANLFLLVKNNRITIKRTLLKIARIILYVSGVISILEGFSLYELIRDFIIEIFETSWKIGETSIAVGDILLFFFSIWVSIKLSKFIRFILDGEILPRVNLPRDVPSAISLMVNYVILSIGFIFALVAVGFELSKFAIVAGALGVGIGFGMQNIVNNFISGLILLFERPIQIGDTIGIQNLVGTVKRIGIRSSVIKGFDGSEEIVPNADLVSFRVTNWTLSDKFRRIEIKLGVEYGTNPEQVIELLKYSISSREDVVKEPAAYVLFDGYGENTLDFTFRFWTTNSGDWIFIRSDVLLYINTLLKEAGIKIPFPQMDVHLNNKAEKDNTKIDK